jgi:hypothetical protein
VEGALANTAGSQILLALNYVGARALLGGDVDNAVWGSGEWHVCEVHGDGTAGSFVTIDNSTTVTGTLGGTLTLNNAPDLNYTTVFEFAEIVVVKRALTTEERALLYTWMSEYMNGA